MTFPCGHPRDAENTALYVRKDRPDRQAKCRTCDRARAARYYEANRERVIARQIAYSAARYERHPRPIDPVAFPCGHPRDLWNTSTRVVSESGRRRQECRVCAVERRRVYSRHRNHVRREAVRASRTVITLSALIERDGDRCYLCGEQVSDALPVIHPRKANMEHVVPLSRGGTHTLDNVRVACRECNSAKGARIAS